MRRCERKCVVWCLRTFPSGLSVLSGPSWLAGEAASIFQEEEEEEAEREEADGLRGRK